MSKKDFWALAFGVMLCVIMVTSIAMIWFDLAIIWKIIMTELVVTVFTYLQARTYDDNFEEEEIDRLKEEVRELREEVEILREEVVKRKGLGLDPLF